MERHDGFGAQFQTIVYGILYAHYNNYEYVYRPIQRIGIYTDPDFYKRINTYLNLEKYFTNYYLIEDKSSITVADFGITRSIVENNIDILLESTAMKQLKNIFWENKSTNVYENKNNIAIHIRRHNKHDFINGELRPYNSLEYYHNIIKNLRRIYNHFTIHIFSQGRMEEFDEFVGDDVVLHIDEDMHQNDFFETFLYLISADVLVTSRSSFSYIAAYLSDGIIYYENICHKPSSSWRNLSELV